MFDLARQSFDWVSEESDDDLSLAVDSKLRFLRIQFIADNEVVAQRLCETLNTQPPSVSIWRSLAGANLLWDRPGDWIIYGDPESVRQHEHRMLALNDSGATVAVIASDNLLALRLSGSAVNHVLSSTCGYDFHSRDHAQAMTTCFESIKVRLVLEATELGGRRSCYLIVDRSYLHYVVGRLLASH